MNEVSSLLAAPVIVAARFDPVLALTTLISASYVGANRVAPEKLPTLILGIHKTLATLAKPANGGATSAYEPLARGVRGAVPAVDLKRSVFQGHILCLDCGQQLKTLKRHLFEVHGLTPERYRLKWRLPDSYPMVAEEYSKARSAMAKEMGLGRKPRTGKR